MKIRERVLSLIICVALLAGSFCSCSIFNGKAGKQKSSAHATDSLISEEEAIGIALKRVQGATSEDLVRFEMEQDDEHWIYVGDIMHQGIEYSFEIEACNGNILVWEIDK